jgi:DNA polymerase-4
MERRILCFNVPAFEIALARIDNPSLSGWPTGVAPSHNSRSVLWEVSAEARQEGLYRGMPLSHARRICPALRVLAPDPRRVSLGQRLLQEAFLKFSPVYEVANKSEFYADLTGSARLFGDAASLAARMRNEISSRYRIKGATAVATNKLVSGVAANVFDRPSIYDVRPGQEKSFLAPLPVGCLPGLTRLFGQKKNEVLTNLEELQLRLLGAVAAVPSNQLELVLGGKARLLKQWAVGIDPSPVWPEAEQPIFDFCHLFEIDEIDDDLLLAAVYRLLERVCKTARRHSRSLNSILLALQYSDGHEIIKARTCDPPSCLESQIYPALEEPFFSIRRRVRIRRIRLTARTIIKLATQLDLFGDKRSKGLKRLTGAIDSIQARHGDQSIWAGKRAQAH